MREGLKLAPIPAHAVTAVEASAPGAVVVKDGEDAVAMMWNRKLSDLEALNITNALRAAMNDDAAWNDIVRRAGFR